MNQRGYCIFIDTLCQGSVPLVTEVVSTPQGNESERICVFTSELEAQREIVDAMMTRLQEFLDGQRDFEDAVSVGEYVLEVVRRADGKIFPKSHAMPPSFAGW
jgi:hypothetical protein